jgi:hypothetical protein
MARPKVQFKITKSKIFTSPGVEYKSETEHLFSPPYSTGQLIFVEDDGQIFLDFHNWRRCYSTSNDDRKYGVRYLGVTTTDPKTGVITINGVVVTPKANDMVAFGNIEYIYRAGDDGQLKWLELGNEDAPGWEEEE